MAEGSESGSSLKWPDITVVVLYFLFVLAVGLFVSMIDIVFSSACVLQSSGPKTPWSLQYRLTHGDTKVLYVRGFLLSVSLCSSSYKERQCYPLFDPSTTLVTLSELIRFDKEGNHDL